MRNSAFSRGSCSLAERVASSIALRTGSVFYQEGEYWTIVYEGTVFRLRDTKGLRCVAYLLRHPGRRVAAVDLVTADGTYRSRTSSRPAPDPENARTVVTKRIKAAVHKIAQCHPSLGYHFRTTIKTGYQCAYLPHPEHPIPWTV